MSRAYYRWGVLKVSWGVIAVESQSQTLALRCRGPLAIFTRPEFKSERMTYPVITPSAARGLLESVLWKPAICWRIERILVLSDIQLTSFRRNEVNSRAASPAASLIASGGVMSSYFADEDRAQRNTVALRDVDYIIEAHFEMTPRAGEQDNVNKFVEMFKRRVEKGQQFQQPFFGCRECVADVMPVTPELKPLAKSRDLGVMLWDIEFGDKNVPVFFAARMVDGVVDVPPSAEAARATLIPAAAR